MPLRTVEPDWLLRFLRQTSVVTWTVESRGYVLDVPEWCKLTGQAAEAAQGSGWLDAIHPDDRERVEAAWQTSISHGSLYNTDYRLQCADGIYRWFNVRGVPILDSDGEILQWVGVVLDIPGTHRFGGSSRSGQDQPIPFSDIRPEVLRAARAMLDWSVQDLSRISGVSLSTIKRLESADNGVRSRPENLLKVINALSDSGVRLSGRDGLASGVEVDAQKRQRQ